jgi:hypothetical protein
MFYFDDNKTNSEYPVAISKDDDIIYLHKDKKDKAKIPKKKYDLDYKPYEKLINENYKGKEKRKILLKFQEAYFNNFEEENLGMMDDKFKNVYKHIKTNEDNKSKFTTDTKLKTVLKFDWFDVIYITAPSGAGKTKIIVSMIDTYFNMYYKKKKPPVIVISKKIEDEMLDKIKNIRLDPSTFIEDPIKMDEIEKESIIIFDDFESYENEPYIYNAILSFLTDIITMGRTKKLKVFIVLHGLLKPKIQSLIYNEMTYLILYPNSSSYSTIKRLLEQKVGLDIKKINEIKNLKSKYLIIHKTYPKYIIYSNNVELL